MVAIAITRAASGHPTTQSFALTPDRLGRGKVWLFATSALIVNGPALPQIIGLGIALFVAVRRLGAVFVLALMVVAHIGATLLAYGALGVFTGDADGAHNRNLDYGISAVWLGVIGALFAAALPLARRRDPVGLLALGIGIFAFVFGVAAFPLLAATEHGLAFAIGAASIAALRNRTQPVVGGLHASHPRGSH